MQNVWQNFPGAVFCTDVKGLQRLHKYWMGSLPACLPNPPPPLRQPYALLYANRRVLAVWRVRSMLRNVRPAAQTAARRQERDSLLHMEKCFAKSDGMKSGKNGGKTTKVMLAVNKRPRLDADKGRFSGLLWFL